MTIVLPAAVGTLAPGERTRVLARIVARFSGRSPWRRWGRCWPPGCCSRSSTCGPFGELLSSGYGRAIAVKAVIVVVLIGAGAVNRRRTLPRLRRRDGAGTVPARAGLGLRRVIRGELALMALAIAVTAALVGYAPPATSAAGPVSVNRDLGPARLEMTVVAGPRRGPTRSTSTCSTVAPGPSTTGPGDRPSRPACPAGASAR